MTEEKVVASSLLLNLYNDAENLLNQVGTYYAVYARVAKALESADSIDEAEIDPNIKAALIQTADTIKILAYRVYIRAKAIAERYGLTLPEDITTKMDTIKSAIIYNPSDLDAYVTAVMDFLSEKAISDALLNATQTLESLGA